MTTLQPAPVPATIPAWGGYVFDLDGTLWLGDELLPGAQDLVLGLREAGRGTVFLSNNPTKDRAMYSEKLTRLGIPTPPDQIVNPLVTLTAWLRRESPDAAVFVIGEEPLVRALREAGVRLTDDPAEIDVVVASYDRGFDYRKLQIAFDALWMHRRAILVTTNPDPYCPMPGGRGEPDAAAVVAAIEACTGHRCLVNVGKPSTIILDTAVEVMGVPREECVVVGDRLMTDIAMACDAGISSVLVLTGEGTREAAAALPADRRPTVIVDRVDTLLGPITVP